MKYQCVRCKEIFNEDDIVLTGIISGWGFPTSTVFCEDCSEKYRLSKKSCSDCKSWKTKMKNEPCKSCKDHANWEHK